MSRRRRPPVKAGDHFTIVSLDPYSEIPVNPYHAQIAERAWVNPPEESTTVIDPDNTPQPTPEPTDVETLALALSYLQEALDALRQEVSLQGSALREHKEAIDALRVGPGPSRNDRVAERDAQILAVLRAHPGFKMSAVTVAENLPVAATNGRVADRLRIMAENGLVRILDQKNRKPLFYVDAEA